MKKVLRFLLYLPRNVVVGAVKLVMHFTVWRMLAGLEQLSTMNLPGLKTSDLMDELDRSLEIMEREEREERVRRRKRATQPRFAG